MQRFHGLAFLGTTWPQEKQASQARQIHQRQCLCPESPAASQAIDDFLELILREFVSAWYSNVSKNPGFVNEVDKTIRIALGNLRQRLLKADIIESVTTRFVPILTAHFRDFYDAERAVRGKNLNRTVTESEELDLAIAAKYNDGKLHPAVSLAYSSTQASSQQYLRRLTSRLLPNLLPQRGSRAVICIVRELVACAVLSPIMRLLADSDTWNQLMEVYGRGMLQDRSTVRKLRAALDEHASPLPPSKRAAQFPRLSPGDNERRFEKFVRAIRKTNNISDARRFRSEVASQLKRDATKEGQDQAYLRRLEVSKRMLDQTVMRLAGRETVTQGTTSSSGILPLGDSSLQHASLVEVLHDPAGLSYFMEFMDRVSSMPMLQFWLVVDGFRNPLEDDIAEGDEVPAALPGWTEADRDDLAHINANYLTKPGLSVSDTLRRAVSRFLEAGKDATARQFYFARRAILQAQASVLDTMIEDHFQAFKKSDLFYKCLTSHDTTQTSLSIISPLSPESPSFKPNLPRRTRTVHDLQVRSASRVSMKTKSKKDGLRRQVAVTDVDGLPTGSAILENGNHSQSSIDAKLHVSDDDVDSEALADSVHSLDDSQSGANVPDSNVVQAMEAALNEIMDNKQEMNSGRASLFGEETMLSPKLARASSDTSRRSSVDSRHLELFGRGNERPNISSLGLVNTSSRIGVFTDDDLFPDEEKFMSDEHDDPEDAARDAHIEDEIHAAAPGDLGLAETIAILCTDIDRLKSQNAVVDSLTRKAELTNNTAELRILRKSKASILREMRRKELQRQQYSIQENDNALYGRSTVFINSILIGKDPDGSEYVKYVVEIQLRAGERMPATAWSVSRRYNEFHQLHQRLRMRYASVRALDFPRRRMVMKFQNEFIQRRKAALEKYICALLQLPDVCHSRDLRAFLSRSNMQAASGVPDDNEDRRDMMTRLYNSVTDGMEDILGSIPVLDQLSLAGQNLLSAATSQVMTMSTTVSDIPGAVSEAEAELNAFEDRELQPFVKPICDIFLEVFELNRGNNWLRGRAVVVVLHQLLGGTIERKVRDSINSFISYEAIVKYIALVRQSMWPNGRFKHNENPRTTAQQTKSRTEASLMLATLVPDLAGSVVGRANAQAASRRIFATFNNHRLKWVDKYL